MRLKSMNKTSNSITLSRKNNASLNQQQQEDLVDNNNYDINSGESGFDLNMDSGDDEIDVGTNADSLLMNFSNNSNTSDTSFKSTPNTSAAVGVQNDHQFGTNDTANFAMPQSTSAMSEADRKRAHHNALERKRRDHIKDSFHTLRDAIPNIKGEKVSTSRAQILKAATDYIKAMKSRNSVFQNDIDLLKKQNSEIEQQIRQLEKAKMSASECLRQSATQSFQIKTELEESLANGTHDTTAEFKFDMSEINTTIQTNASHNSTSHTSQPKNNVLIMTKPNSLLGAQPTTSKKFKTIVNTNTKTNNILNNNGNYF